MKKCDYCKKDCVKTKFGSCVILCKLNITLCIDCNSKKVQNEKIKYNYKNFLEKNNILNYLRKREYNLN